MSMSTKKMVITAIAGAGLMFTIQEILSYTILFHHISYHNNIIAANVLSATVIKQRNRTNAISFVGQFLGWVMEVWYVILVGLLSAVYNMESVREISSLLKDLEFVLIPLVEVYISFPITKFIAQKQN